MLPARHKHTTDFTHYCIFDCVSPEKSYTTQAQAAVRALQVGSLQHESCESERCAQSSPIKLSFTPHLSCFLVVCLQWSMHSSSSGSVNAIFVYSCGHGSFMELQQTYVAQTDHIHCVKVHVENVHQWCAGHWHLCLHICVKHVWDLSGALWASWPPEALWRNVLNVGSLFSLYCEYCYQAD